MNEDNDLQLLGQYTGRSVSCQYTSIVNSYLKILSIHKKLEFRRLNPWIAM